MDPQAAAQLVAHGGDASGFRARDLTPALIAESDLVLTATRAHRGEVALMSPKVLRRVFTFCDFADLVAGIEGLSAPVTQTGPRAWVREVTEKAAASRGLKPRFRLIWRTSLTHTGTEMRRSPPWPSG